MNTIGPLQPPGSQKKAQNNVSPFARALASSELEKNSYSKAPNVRASNPFAEALSKTGGHLPQDFGANDLGSMSEYDQQRQLQKMEEQRKKEALRQRLHREINPVDMHDVFKASSERVKKELEEVRRELQMLVQELKMMYKEVDIAVQGQIVNQGTEAKGLRTYFAKLRAFIMLLRQKVHSARTWQQQANTKKSKKNRKIKGGMILESGGHQETKSVWDTMHHEVSASTSGG